LLHQFRYYILNMDQTQIIQCELGETTGKWMVICTEAMQNSKTQQADNIVILEVDE
jgi:hypothetical protein